MPNLNNNIKKSKKVKNNKLKYSKFNQFKNTSTKFKHFHKHGWNSGNENIIKEIGEQAQGYSRINKDSGLARKRWDNYLFILGLFLSASILFISALSGSGAFSNLNIVNYIIAGITAAEMIIKGLNKYYKFQETFPLNLSISKKFQSIAKECDTILQYSRNTRPNNGFEFTIYISNKFKALIHSDDNNMLEYYFIRYHKDFANSDISLPGDIKPININKEDTSSECSNEDKLNELNELNKVSKVNESNLNNLKNLEINKSDSNSEKINKLINNNSISGKNKMNLIVDNMNEHICIQMNEIQNSESSDYDSNYF